MTLAVHGIRWNVLAEHVNKNGPEKPMEDHEGLQVDNKNLILSEGIGVDSTIKPYPVFLSHLLISGSGSSPSEVSLLVLDPVEKKGTILTCGSAISIEEDSSISAVHTDPEKSRNIGLFLDDEAMRNLAESHKNIYLQILRQMNII